MKEVSLGARGVEWLASLTFTSTRGGGVRSRSWPAHFRNSECCHLVLARCREPLPRHREIVLGRYPTLLESECGVRRRLHRGPLFARLGGSQSNSVRQPLHAAF